MKGKAVYVGCLQTPTFTLLSVGATEDEARGGLSAQWDKIARNRKILPSVAWFTKEFKQNPLDYHGATVVLIPVGGGCDIAFSTSLSASRR